MIACCTMDIDLLSVVVRSVWLYKGKEIRMTTAVAPRTVKFRLVWSMPCVVARSANMVFQAISVVSIVTACHQPSVLVVFEIGKM